MKHVLTGFLLLISFSVIFAQNSTSEILLSELKVGDKMPDISLGTVMSTNEKVHFSAFKGKLVIIDFWSVYCGPCILSFPKMVKLQQKYNDKIQILLVNAIDNKDVVEKWYSNPENKRFIPELPIIYNANELRKLFPHVYVPHHVWIDSNGVVQLIGASVNTNETKIEALLSGNEISYIKNANMVDFDQFIHIPVYKLVNENVDSSASYFSFTQSYNDDLGNLLGNFAENLYDTVLNKNRNTYVNMPLSNLFYFTVNKRFDSLARIGSYINGTQNSRTSRVMLLVKDTSLCSIQFNEQRTDLDMRKCSYTYEQLSSLEMSEEKRKELMLQDLNSYFEKKIGIKGSIEYHNVPCYILIHSPKVKKIKQRNGVARKTRFIQDKKEYISYENYYFKDILEELSGGLFSKNKKMIILNETSINGKIDLIVPDPQTINTLQDLENALKSYGIEIKAEIRKMEMLVLRQSEI